ncbi:MAG: pyrroline-5-carboxylate reductase family protein [Thermoguttaceae bacterium]
MAEKTIGFVGGGRIVRVLLGGWARAGNMPRQIVVSDVDEQVLARLKQQYPNLQTVLGDNAPAASQEIVLLALHPPAIPEALPKLRPALRGEAVLVSLAPKLTIARLSALLGGFDRIARMIPNAPSLVGAGLNPIAYAGPLSFDDRNSLQQLLAPLGECPEVPEEKLEAYAVITAMGPTYFWPVLYELIGLAESFGLSRPEAASAVKQMLAGTLATMIQSGLDPQGVHDLIPVRPLADAEPMILEAYRTKLKGVFEKIRP